MRVVSAIRSNRANQCLDTRYVLLIVAELALTRAFVKLALTSSLLAPRIPNVLEHGTL